MEKRRIIFTVFAMMLFLFAPVSDAEAATLPKKYRTEELTSVKDQKSTGLCWAHAGASAMETELIKNNGADEKLDLSEIQLAYFIKNPAMDSLGQLNLLFGDNRNLNDGSNTFKLAGMLAYGVSPVAETKPGVTVDTLKDFTVLDSSLANTGAYYMKECKFLRNASRDEMKEAIMQYGGMVVSFHSSSTRNYNKETYGWYNPEEIYSDHAVYVVGWDDTYSKKNFTTSPEGNGAWIVKNSYGEEWGDEGYFYLSYYDKSMGSSENAVFDMEQGKYADNIYQNSFSVSSGEYWNEEGKRAYGNAHLDNVSKLANVFTAQANNAGAESLKAVSLFTHEAGNYEINIFNNVEINTNPESGTLAATLKGKISAPGFVILPLEDPVYLSEGQSFSVVVKLTDENGNHIGVAQDYGENTLSVSGQCFVYYTYNEGYWYDYGRGNHLFCIKAYTDNITKNKKADVEKVSMIVDADIPSGLLKNYPECVTGITVSHKDSDSVTFSWNKDGYGYYVVYRYNDTAKTWQKIGYTDKNYYKVTGLSTGKSYTFGVKAIGQPDEFSDAWDYFYESLEYAQVSETTDAVKRITPKVTVSEKGNALTWSKISGATKYVLYVMSPETEYEWKSLKTVKSSEKQKYTHTKVSDGLTYTYRVYAYKDDKLISKGVPVSVLHE